MATTGSLAKKVKDRLFVVFWKYQGKAANGVGSHPSYDATLPAHLHIVETYG